MRIKLKWLNRIGITQSDEVFWLALILSANQVMADQDRARGPNNSYRYNFLYYYTVKVYLIKVKEEAE